MRTLRFLISLVFAAAAAHGQTAAYPSAIATDTQLRVAANNVQTTTTFPLLSSDTTVLVANGTGIVANSVLTIDNENLAICNVSGGTLTVGYSSCPNVDGRGFDGTSATTHASGATAALNIDAWHHNALKAEVKAIETALGASLANVTVPNPLTQNKGGTGTSSPLTGILFGNGAGAFTGTNISGIVFANGASAPTASQPSGILLGNGASAPTGLAAAADLQTLRRKPNQGATAVYEFAAPTLIKATDYQFTAQQPGGSLSVGSNTITLSPCPLGVNGTDSGHQLYISGGTGAGSAEAVPITGGTCTSGAASGTVVVTVAACGGGTCHSGAWTIQSASAGIAEASFAAGAGGAIYIPAGTYHLKGTVTFADSQAVTGAGMGQTFIVQDYTSGDAFSLPCGNACLVSGLNFSTGVTITSGYYIRMTNGEGAIHGIWFNDGWSNIMADAVIRGTVDDIRSINQASQGIQIGGATGASGLTISNWTMSSTVNSAKGLECYSGLFNVTNLDWQLTGTNTRGIFFNPGGGLNCDESTVSNSTFDSMQTTILRQGAGRVIDVLFDNIYSPGPSGSQFFAGNASQGLTFQNIKTIGRGSASFCWAQLIGGSNYTFSNIQAGDFSQANTCGFAVGYGASPFSGLTVTGARIGKANAGGTDANSGTPFIIATGSDDIQIDGDFYGATAIVTNSATLTKAAIKGLGIDDVTPAIATAATLAFPINPNFTLTGTTNITAVSGLWAGRTGRITPTGGTITFTAGASIGNSFIAAQNSSFSYYFDGTKIWLNGQTPALTNSENYIASETGANNAIAGALTGVATGDGLCVTVQLAHTLQAGANTFALNGGSAVAIKSHLNTANNIGTAYAATGRWTGCYNSTGPVWMDMGQ